MKNIIYSILKNHPQGISEFDLLEMLQEQATVPLFAEVFSSNLKMFQAHFLLFNTLYKLQGELHKKKEAHLEIHTIKIILGPFSGGKDGLQQGHDKLREYYLNFSHFEETTENEVDDLLNQFWNRYFNIEERLQALKILGLQDPVSYKTIKSRYRELVKKYHPDGSNNPAESESQLRKGNTLPSTNDMIRAINSAMAVLEKTDRQRG